MLSYIPVFDLHFEVLRSLGMLKRLKNMENMDGYDSITQSFCQVEMNDDQISLIKRFSECESIYPNLKLTIEIPSLNPISYDCTQDLSLIDIV